MDTTKIFVMDFGEVLTEPNIGIRESKITTALKPLLVSIF